MNQKLTREWIDAINDQDLTRLRKTLADNFVWELGTSSTQGAQASVESWRLWFIGFPDFRFELLRMISDGPFVVSQVRMRGTHKGDFRFRGTKSMDKPLAPTNRPFDLPACAVHEIRDGEITHLWAYWDTATLLRQLGLLAA